VRLFIPLCHYFSPLLGSTYSTLSPQGHLPSFFFLFFYWSLVELRLPRFLPTPFFQSAKDFWLPGSPCWRARRTVFFPFFWTSFLFESRPLWSFFLTPKTICVTRRPFCFPFFPTSPGVGVSFAFSPRPPSFPLFSFFLLDSRPLRAMTIGFCQLFSPFSRLQIFLPLLDPSADKVFFFSFAFFLPIFTTEVCFSFLFFFPFIFSPF